MAAASSSSAVKAGRAYAELTLQDRMSPALDRAKKRFEAFASGTAAAATYFTLAGSAIVGGITAALVASLVLAGQLQDISDRTGVSADALSELAFAAEQTGASIEAVEAALRGLSKFTLQLAKGGKQASQALQMLGINAQDFLAADPIAKLGLLADGLARIEDPSLRSALAMAVLGKSGTALLPMLKNGAAGLDEMIERARRLGISLDKDTIQKLDDLGDELGVIKSQGRAALFAIAGAVVGPLMQVVTLAQDATAGVIEFIKNNAALVRVLALVGVGLLVVGGLLLSLSVAATAASLVMTGLASAMTLASGAAALFGTVVTVVKALLAPELLVIYGALILVTAALAAGVYAWVSWTDSGKAAVANIGREFEWLVDFVATTMGGLYDAIMAGEWGLAFAIVVKSMEVVWLQVLHGFEITWQGFAGFFSDTWVGVVAGAQTVFASLLPAVVGTLARIQQAIVAWANAVAEALGLEIRFDGLDALNEYNADVQASYKQQRAAIAANAQASIEANRKDREAKVATARDAVTEARDELDALRTIAGKRRDAAAAKSRRPSPPSSSDTGGGLLMPEAGGGVLGTFSASVAGLLGQSSPDIADSAKKTAENTGEMKDLLEDLLGKAENGGLVFE